MKFTRKHRTNVFLNQFRKKIIKKYKAKMIDFIYFKATKKNKTKQKGAGATEEERRTCNYLRHLKRKLKINT